MHHAPVRDGHGVHATDVTCVTRGGHGVKQVKQVSVSSPAIRHRSHACPPPHLQATKIIYAISWQHLPDGGASASTSASGNGSAAPAAAPSREELQQAFAAGKARLARLVDRLTTQAPQLSAGEAGTRGGGRGGQGRAGQGRAGQGRAGQVMVVSRGCEMPQQTVYNTPRPVPLTAPPPRQATST